MKPLPASGFLRVATVAVALSLIGGCSGLLPKPQPQPTYYALDASGAAREQHASAGTERPRPSAAPTLVVNPPRAAAGYDSQRILYVRQAHKLEYFAHSQWIDTPARMLAPLIVAAVDDRGTFDAVLQSASGANGDLRLDIEILRLQQDFSSSPSQVRFTLRAYLVDSSSRRVLDWRDFDHSVAARSDDPYGGVIAANHAVHTVLAQLAAFCADAAANWQAPYKTRSETTPAPRSP